MPPAETATSPPARLVKLREAESVLAPYFVEGSRPSRNTIVAWIEDGTLTGIQVGVGRNYYVSESSLLRFVASITRGCSIAIDN